MPTEMLIVLVLIVLCIIFALSISLFNNNTVTNNNVIYNNSSDLEDLKKFEHYYLSTLLTKHIQKPEKVANPTRPFSNDGNMFEGLQPWSLPSDFGIAMHTLIGYGVRFKTPDDVLYENSLLAENLCNAVLMIYNHLPYPAPINAVPWGLQTDWYHFSIYMPECLQNTCIVLKGYYDVSLLVEHILYHYLPEPTLSMGWRKTAGDAIRMGLPYAYAQLLRGYTYKDIRFEPEMVHILNMINFSLVPIGDGIHYDYAYFERNDVRTYGNLLNSFFTISYYNFLFGDEVVRMDNLNASINLVGSPAGFVHPAMLSRQGSNYSNVIGSFVAYKNEAVSADFSKILTVRTPLYYGSVVGQTSGVAYYEADENNNLHAPLWAMTRKIWANQGRVINYKPGTLGLESGVILTVNTNGMWSVPTTKSSPSSFYPTFAQTAICTTVDAGVMVSRVILEELHLAYDSYTLYHPKGMLQLYDKILSTMPIVNSARCIVLTKDLTVDTPWETASNTATSNMVTARHINIANNPSFSNFSIRSFNHLNMQTLEQLISATSVNTGVGMSCFSLTVDTDDDDTQVSRVAADAFVITTGSLEVAVQFPMVVLKDNISHQVTINDASSDTRNTHEILFSKLNNVLSYINLNVKNLYSDTVKQLEDKFVYHNTQANQFKFVFRM
ncbi:ODV-E66 [Mocis latipes granulovirus]|uniref:ODV-E66 n=1 Tax=Mocis latipes granulovirus TaxID=2072024 RepID=A0A162GX38_9BBAC|nr:ODV-E66 [Mocis latipes granulovirus]AKR17533.1 ODV-E66 [Mocis latipes granulovirus]